jgi:hypothetical protein
MVVWLAGCLVNQLTSQLVFDSLMPRPIKQKLIDQQTDKPVNHKRPNLFFKERLSD